MDASIRCAKSACNAEQQPSDSLNQTAALLVDGPLSLCSGFTFTLTTLFALGDRDARMKHKRHALKACTFEALPETHGISVPSLHYTDHQCNPSLTIACIISTCAFPSSGPLPLVRVAPGCFLLVCMYGVPFAPLCVWRCQPGCRCHPGSLVSSLLRRSPVLLTWTLR